MQRIGQRDAKTFSPHPTGGLREFRRVTKCGKSIDCATVLGQQHRLHADGAHRPGPLRQSVKSLSRKTHLTVICVRHGKHLAPKLTRARRIASILKN